MLRSGDQGPGSGHYSVQAMDGKSWPRVCDGYREVSRTGLV
jgi:hypothetical protein